MRGSGSGPGDVTSRRRPSVRAVRAALSGAVVVATLALTAPRAAADDPPPDLSRCRNVITVAHRGATQGFGVGPTEDTLNAFRRVGRLAAAAAPLGLRVGAETDIRYVKSTSTSGIWVNNHDETLDRTTTGTGLVADRTRAYVRRIRADDGQSVTGYRTALQFMATTSAARFEIELKPTSVSVARLRYLVSWVAAYHLRRRVVFTSFYRRNLRRLATVDPGIARGYLSQGALDLTQVPAFAGWVMLRSDLATPDRVTAAHQAGLKVGVWTVDTPEEWASLVGLGVEEILTNRATGYRDWCQQQQP